MLHTAVAPSLPASVVTHTVSGYFLPDSLAAHKAKEVVVIRQNHLTLYRVQTSSTLSALPINSNHVPLDQLGQVAEVSLHAPPLAAATCHPFRATSDILVLLLDDFHVSFLQFNPVTFQFDTVALVQLDDRQLVLDRCPLDALLRVDQTGSYVAVLAKRSDVFFFPVLELLDPAALAAARAEAAANDSTDAATYFSSDALGNASAAGNDEGAAASIQAAAPAKVTTVALNAWGDDDDEHDDEEPEEYQQQQEHEQDEKKPPTANGPSETQTYGVEASLAPGAAVPFKKVSTEAGAGPSMLLRIGSVTHWCLQEVKTTLRNVRDMQFVESVGEPLLAFLFEKYPTWAGRVKLLEWRSKTVEANMLTCSIEWIKVTLANSAAPHMLSLSEVDGLPYDVTSMTPLPAFQDVPSAVLCVSRNMLVHVSTKSGYGAYINTNGEDEVRNLKSSAVTFASVQWRSTSQATSTELVKVNLNFANATVVVVPSHASQEEGEASSQRLLIVTEDDGTVVEVHLVSQGYTVGTVAVEIVMTGCFCAAYAAVDATRFFFGAMNGDSRFIACTPHDPCKVVQRFIGIGPVRDMDIVDTTTTTNLNADILDPSVQASPFADLYRSVELEPQPSMTAVQQRAVMDLALCSGTGSAGTLSVLRRSVRSRVVRHEELNAISVFFLEPSLPHSQKRRREDEGAAAAGASNGVLNAGSVVAQFPHLLISGINFSILFAVRSDSVQQVRGAALSVAARTVYAAHLDWLGALLQITEAEVRLLSVDGKRKMASAEFQSIPALQSSGAGGGSAAVAANLALSAFVIEKHRRVLVRFTNGQLLSIALEGTKNVTNATVLLSNVAAMAWWPSSQALVVIQNANLVLYELPPARGESVNLTEHSVFPNFALIPPFAVEGVETPAVKLRERLNAEPLPTVTHLAVFDQHENPANSAAPTEATLVLILSSGELVTYRVVPPDGYAPRRCIKQVYHILDVVPETDLVESVETRKRRLQEERARLASVTRQMRHCTERLIAFQGLQNRYKGLYVCGQTPVFLIYHPPTNQLIATRHHNMSAVRGFAPFHSRHVQGGFVYCAEGFVHFATMQPFGELINSEGWWLERVRLGCTPHRITYSPAAHGCFVVASRPQPFAPKKAPFDVQLRMTEDEEGNRMSHVVQPVALPPLSVTAGAPVPMNERYEVQFFSTADWQCTDRFVLDENEKVLATTLMKVTRDTTMDAPGTATTAPVCALATAYPLGEDVTSRGRILLLATSHLDGRAQQLRSVHDEPMKGSVTAITSVADDCVAVAVGGTVRVYRYDANKANMATMAILYAGAYVTHLSAFRDYLVVGDLFHSILFARYSAENHTITILGRDTSTTSVVFNDMLYHDSRFGLVVSDDQRNLICMQYRPRVQEEPGKPPKVLEALLNVGGEYRLAGGVMTKMIRLRCATKDAKSSIAIYVTNNGEVGYLVPLGDQTSRTGQWVVRRLQTEVAHAAGLPPRMFLSFSQDDPLRSLKGEEWLLHVPLLMQLFRQDLRTRKLIAAAAQTQLDRALNVGATVAAELGAI
ncbi:cleavage and polyadenylation specificity factor- like protein [Leptomonas pyrrhocoris]|uniref:Cleavage and polyadenylation specificity factor-like protein n=1 Tax=Leptomonas pyrrhocoris TaxID=157538 RepID=A0A0N0DYZ7_LEPPY|nr:cleavage and polyadenylation specificity factor- like protein [Leptomonas pyrrhocoris]KPA84671.1 cleavage and polyadenylation specificity factor- like protein [Leptomonas pyrrhocoris]|eukprot:XP_015663110.1 cleavage and polyadenylation specificity factor- like protein [Leptomonas pyrrhocoris]